VEGSYTGKYLKPILERDRARTEAMEQQLKELEKAAL
jgi:excinuclease ABC subunit A